MLTRFRVNGFKNLVDVDLRFGPFTCIAGANGVGKSNLFDAIRFLSALADDHSLVEAASSVREGKTSDLGSLFHRVGNHVDPKMSFIADMIVPATGEDDLGQEAKATITFLRYSLDLSLKETDEPTRFGGIQILKEELVHINIGGAKQHLLFGHKPEWRKSVIHGRRTRAFISTEHEGTDRAEIKLHQDRGDESGGGRPASRRAATLPRTVLSSANAVENRTALLARREMQSWRLLQLEPSALREPDLFSAPARMGSNGSHLASTLYHLGRKDERVYSRIANRLSELIDDIREVGVDIDHQRELFSVYAKGKDGTFHPARSLSDGTLRFLALAVIELDPSAQGVLCLEEPENGIHPDRLPAMLSLIQDIATDTDSEVGVDNPLRQVLINTHSPSVVRNVPEDSLVVAASKETLQEHRRFQRVSFGCLPGTWRETDHTDTVPLGILMGYLNSVEAEYARPQKSDQSQSQRTPNQRPRTVAARPDIQQMLLFGNDE